MTRLSALLWVSTAMILTSCGKVGPLEQPAPMYGAKAKADYQAKKAAAAAAKASNADDNPEPLAPDTPGPNNPGAVPNNLRVDPAPGMPQLPNAPGLPGVLPDPYNRPQ